MFFTTKRPNIKLPPIHLGNAVLEQVYLHKHLGVTLMPTLNWNEHISNIIAKANKRLSTLKCIKYRVSRKALEICYSSFVRPILEYGNVLYDSCTKEQSERIENVQRDAARVIIGAKKRSSGNLLYKELGWQSLKHRRYIHKMVKLYAVVNKISPQYLTDTLLSFQRAHVHNTRTVSNSLLDTPRTKKVLFSKSFFISAINSWNKLDICLRNAPSKGSFRRNIMAMYKISTPVFNNNVSRKAQIILGQLRIEFSDLNAHLFDKGCVESPNCGCGHSKEDTKHFLMTCPTYTEIRNDMFHAIHLEFPNLAISPQLLLYGNSQQDSVNNKVILHHTCEYLLASKRFLQYMNNY